MHFSVQKIIRQKIDFVFNDILLNCFQLNKMRDELIESFGEIVSQINRSHDSPYYSR